MWFKKKQAPEPKIAPPNYAHQAMKDQPQNVNAELEIILADYGSARAQSYKVNGDNYPYGTEAESLKREAKQAIQAIITRKEGELVHSYIIPPGQPYFPPYANGPIISDKPMKVVVYEQTLNKRKDR